MASLKQLAKYVPEMFRPHIPVLDDIKRIAIEAGERILDLGDQQLKGLKSLTALYKADIDKRNELLRERGKLAPK